MQLGQHANAVAQRRDLPDHEHPASPLLSGVEQTMTAVALLEASPTTLAVMTHAAYFDKGSCSVGVNAVGDVGDRLGDGRDGLHGISRLP